jgi:hypothetical protein
MVSSGRKHLKVRGGEWWQGMVLALGPGPHTVHLGSCEPTVELDWLTLGVPGIPIAWSDLDTSNTLQVAGWTHHPSRKGCMTRGSSEGERWGGSRD